MTDKLKTRDEKLLSYIDKVNGKGLEIGPSYNPVLPKSSGYDVLTVDHCSKEELIEKYKYVSTVDVNKIEEVDFVWKSGSLHELIGKEKYFDHIVASHLIEHIPNPIAWFQDISLMLRDNGVLVIALPEKNYCFDFSRPVTTTGQWLQAFAENRNRHSQATIFDSISYYTVRDKERYAWNQTDYGKLSFKSDIETIYNEYLRLANEKDYVDFHFSVFTYISFQLLIGELNYYGLTDFIIEKIYPPSGCEFIVILRKSDVRISSEKLISIRSEYLSSQHQPYPGYIIKFINRYICILNYLYRIARAVKRRLIVKK